MRPAALISLALGLWTSQLALAASPESSPAARIKARCSISVDVNLLGITVNATLALDTISVGVGLGKRRLPKEDEDYPPVS
ncbi:hypothetical protein BT69DRAFT_1332629 [Atractiella rhizophila]|nr:hypothetical protein BT69DRAFT_1332629 [Atractiella rhizophila]